MCNPNNPKRVVIVLHYSIEDVLTNSSEITTEINFVSNSNWKMMVIDDLERSYYADFSSMLNKPLMNALYQDDILDRLDPCNPCIADDQN